LEPVRFPSGGIELEGLLWIPEGEARGPGLAACHPHPLYGGDMRNLLLVRLCRAVGALGRPVLRFNFRGVGKSGGRHGEGIGEREDVRAAVDFLARRWGEVDVLGYSFGAWMGLEGGGENPHVRRIAAVAPPVGFLHMSEPTRSLKPKLVVAGTHDEFAPLPILDAWYARLSPPKERVTIQGADHFFAGREGEVAAAVAQFLA
jgi:alpha/beta superfamily hydrolase